ncbi:MAG: hypothetical protein K0S55_187 [Clostridia bacterium]|nr:hypothetical protein [Clostridia bacterium]
MKLYVNVNGCDNNEGTESAPICSLQRAIELSYGQAEEIEILLSGGNYSINEPIYIHPGMPKTTVKPLDDGIVSIFGGRRINGFTKSTINGIACWVADVKKETNEGIIFRSLFVNGCRAVRPRLPKKGYYKIAGLPDSNSPAKLFEGESTFYAAEGDFQGSWKYKESIMINVLHYWIDEHLPLVSYDEATRLVTTGLTTRMTLTNEWGADKFAKYYLDNVFEALTESGEFYYEREKTLLYYIPKQDEDMETAEVIVPVISQFLLIEGDATENKFIEGLTFENINFEYTEIRQPKGLGEHFCNPDSDIKIASQAAARVMGTICLQGTRDCAFTGCSFKHLGLYGIDIQKGCSGITVSQCELCDLAAGGIRVGGAAYEGSEQLHTHHITIKDCIIRNGGLYFHSACGILITHAAYNVISHNEIHDLYYTGISCGWVWGYADNYTKENLIEKNHIYKLGYYALSDMGGIYTLGVQPGTVIRGNYIHDIERANYGGWAIYPDEGSSHIVIENNICYGTSSPCFHQHYGRENIVRNNIFALAGEGQIAYTRPELHTGFTFERNIIVSDGIEMYRFTPGKHKVQIDLNLYYDLTGSCIFSKEDGKEMTLSEVQLLGCDLHSVIADPLFKDIKSLSNKDINDFTLAENSPAFALGFKAIDLSDVGPKKTSI